MAWRAARRAAWGASGRPLGSSRAPRRRCSSQTEQWGSWETLQAYATNPADFADVAWHFGRAPGAQQRYAEYRRWCASRGVTIHDDVVASVDWRDGGGFEPSWAPYNLSNLDDERIEHWVLWHHPDQLPGDAVLRPERERALLAGLLRRHGAALPTSDRLVIFQNEPSRRSLPSIAHSQVFFRLGDPEGTELASTLERLRREWEERAVRRRQALDET